MLESISDIKHAFYINLINRTDRKSYIELELEKVGIKAERFNAIKLADGRIGCSLLEISEV